MRKLIYFFSSLFLLSSCSISRKTVSDKEDWNKLATVTAVERSNEKVSFISENNCQEATETKSSEAVYACRNKAPLLKKVIPSLQKKIGSMAVEYPLAGILLNTERFEKSPVVSTKTAPKEFESTAEAAFFLSLAGIAMLIWIFDSILKGYPMGTLSFLLPVALFSFILVLSIVGLARINNHNDRYKGLGMAIGALAISLGGLLFSIFVLNLIFI